MQRLTIVVIAIVDVINVVVIVTVMIVIVVIVIVAVAIVVIIIDGRLLTALMSCRQHRGVSHGLYDVLGVVLLHPQRRQHPRFFPHFLGQSWHRQYLGTCERVGVGVSSVSGDPRGVG